MVSSFIYQMFLDHIHLCESMLRNAAALNTQDESESNQPNFHCILVYRGQVCVQLRPGMKSGT
jgi:hypothetical protein